MTARITQLLSLYQLPAGITPEITPEPVEAVPVLTCPNVPVTNNILRTEANTVRYSALRTGQEHVGKYILWDRMPPSREGVSNLRGITFRDCYFGSFPSEIDLEGTKFIGCFFDRSGMYYCRMGGVVFDGCVFNCVVFEYDYFQSFARNGVTIEATKFLRCEFRSCPGSRSQCLMYGCNLEGVVFEHLHPAYASQQYLRINSCTRVPDSVNACRQGAEYDVDDDAVPYVPVPTAAPGESKGRVCGFELEFNEYPNAAMQRWKNDWRSTTHEDGSCGYEAVSRPITRSETAACVAQCCAALRNDTVNENCGLHVHVDGRDVRWADMRRLCMLYSRIEPALFMIAGQHRARNSYCKPCGETFGLAATATDYKGAILAAALAERSNRGARSRMRDKDAVGKKGGERYQALNIMPWIAGRAVKAPDTTVEFRLHRNTKDPRRVTGWVNTCRAIVDAAVGMTDKEVLALPKSPIKALYAIVHPEERPYILWRVAAYRKTLGWDQRIISVRNRRIMTKWDSTHRVFDGHDGHVS